MADKTEVLAWITGFLREAGTAVHGSTLAKAYREQFPGAKPSDLGFVNLKAAVLNIPGVAIVGRSGLDVIYRLGGESDGPTPCLNNKLPTPWAVWTQPDHRRVLAIDPSGQVEVVAPKSRAYEISPLSHEAHKGIAESFLETLPQDHEYHQLLSDALATGEDWWQYWVRATQKGRSIHGEWIVHRLAKLSAALKEQLATLPITTQAQQIALDQVLGSRKQAKEATNRDTRRPSSPPLEAPIRELRSMIKAAVDLMDEDTINNLHIPPSILWKVMAQQKQTQVGR